MGENELQDRFPLFDEGADRINKEKRSISKRVEELEKLEWERIERPSRGLTEDQIDSLIKDMRSTDFAKYLGKDRIVYYEFQKGDVKIDLNNREIYFSGELDEKTRKIIGI